MKTVLFINTLFFVQNEVYIYIFCKRQYSGFLKNIAISELRNTYNRKLSSMELIATLVAVHLCFQSVSFLYVLMAIIKTDVSTIYFQVNTVAFLSKGCRTVYYAFE